MNRWQKQFSEHAIHQAIEELQEALGHEPENLESYQFDELVRARLVVEECRNRLSEVDARLLSFPLLDEISNVFKGPHVLGKAKAFAVGDNNQLQPINETLTGLIPKITQLPRLDVEAEISTVISVAEESSKQALDKVLARAKSADDHLNELASGLESLAKEKDKLEQSLSTRKQELDSLITQFQKQFSDAQESRSQKYSEWFSSIDQKVREDSRELRDATEKELQHLIADSTTKHDDIKELYELAAGDSIAGGYSQTATSETTQANIWRLISLGFIGATIAWLLVVVFYFLQPDLPIDIDAAEQLIENAAPDWYRMIINFSITGVLLFGAAFSSQQSTKHRNEAKKARGLALQIKALEPYIYSLDTDKQKELKERLAEKFFFGVENGESDESVIHESSFKSITSTIVEILKASK